MNNPEFKQYFAGLDLGQAQDFTALAIVEMVGTVRAELAFNCRFLKRWPLRTPYPAIVADTVEMMNSAEMQAAGKPTLAVDATGVGAPVIDLFKQERLSADLKPVQITGGTDENFENGTYRVPKRNLVSMVQVPLQRGRLKIVEAPETANLLREMQNFKVKISDTAHDSYGSWREGSHDDLILAVSLALWAANRWKPKVIVHQPNHFYQTSY